MKQVVAYVVASHGYSERKACLVTRQHRSTQRSPSRRDPRTAVRQRMHEIVATRIRYGYRCVHVMLKREGWQVGKNVVYRLYREEGLVLRTKQPRRRKMIVHRQARSKPQRPNEAWRRDYNVSRPHMGLGNLTPVEYLARSETWPAPIGVGQAGS